MCHSFSNISFNESALTVFLLAITTFLVTVLRSLTVKNINRKLHYLHPQGKKLNLQMVSLFASYHSSSSLLYFLMEKLGSRAGEEGGVR